MNAVTTESPAASWVIGALSFVVVAAVVIALYGMPGRGGAPRYAWSAGNGERCPQRKHGVFTANRLRVHSQEDLSVSSVT